MLHTSSLVVKTVIASSVEKEYELLTIKISYKIVGKSFQCEDCEMHKKMWFRAALL